MGLILIYSCESKKSPLIKAYEKADYLKVVELAQVDDKRDTTNNYALLFAIGDAYYNLKKYDSAKKYLLLAKELNKEDKMLFFKLGKSEYLTDGTGFVWFGVSLTIDNDFEDAWYYLGLSTVESGNYENAIKNFNRTLELNPDHHHCYQQLSLCYLLLDKPLDAIETIDQAIEMKDSSYYFYQKAVITDYLGLYPESLALCDSSLVRDSLHVNSIALKAQNLINLSRFKQGCELVEKIKLLDSERDVSHYREFCD